MSFIDIVCDRQTVDKAISALANQPKCRFVCDIATFGIDQFFAVRSPLADEMYAVTDCMIGAAVYATMLGHKGFIVPWEPEPKHENLLRGKIGSIYGCQMWSDAYCHPEEKFLDPYEFIFFGQKPTADTRYSYGKLLHLKDKGCFPQGPYMEREVYGTKARDEEIMAELRAVVERNP